MSQALHVSKRTTGGWEVKRAGAARASSVHSTRAEAVAAARRFALKSGGAEVVTHRADGRIASADTVGAATLDELKRLGRVAPPPPRAPRTDGPRTTLRVPASLSAVADRLAAELGVSRNDALTRLATRGAELYEREQSVAATRAARWAAVVPGVIAIERTDLPSADEARAAVLEARDAAADKTA